MQKTMTVVADSGLGVSSLFSTLALRTVKAFSATVEPGLDTAYGLVSAA